MFLCLLIQLLPEFFVLDLFSMWSAPLFPFPFVHVSFVYGSDQELIRRVDSHFTRSEHSQTDKDTITTIVSRYYEQDTWKSDLIFNEESFNLLQDILENSGELKERVPYEELVTTTFAKKAAH